MEELELIATMAWAIQRDRNKKFHGEEIPPPDLRSKWIVDYLESFQKANLKPQSGGSRNNRAIVDNRCAYQDPPERGFWKINVDAAWVQSPPSTGIGIIGRNLEGESMGDSSLFFDMDFQNPMAELIAILEGIRMAKAFGYGKIIVESDSSQAVNLALKQSKYQNELEPLVEVIWSQMSFFTEIKIRHILRKKKGS